MKLCIVTSKGNYKIANTGKGRFIKRLVPALQKLGVYVTSDPSEKTDVSLHIGKILCLPNTKKNIVRMGPSHCSTHEDYRALNKRKAKAIRKADGVIYQSEFCKRMCDHFLGEAKCLTTVIYNGADPKFYEDIEPAESDFQYNFLAATRVWTKQKRLKYIIRAFEKASIPNARLWIAGTAPKEKNRYECNHIHFLGLLDDRELGSYYKLCNALIHMCYLDACPNVVTEAMVAGCKVIWNSEAGTWELGGLLLEAREGQHSHIYDPKWDFKPTDLRHPPKVNTDKLASWITKYVDDSRWYDPSLYIDNIARLYKGFFEKCLNSK